MEFIPVERGGTEGGRGERERERERERESVKHVVYTPVELRS